MQYLILIAEPLFLTCPKHTYFSGLKLTDYHYNSSFSSALFHLRCGEICNVEFVGYVFLSQMVK